MDCRVSLTSHDINSMIAVLYLQTHLEDDIALNLIDKLNGELDRCTTEQSGSRAKYSEEYLQKRQQLTRQLYFQNRIRGPRQ